MYLVLIFLHQFDVKEYFVSLSVVSDIRIQTGGVACLISVLLMNTLSWYTQGVHATGNLVPSHTS